MVESRQAGDQPDGLPIVDLITGFAQCRVVLKQLAIDEVAHEQAEAETGKDDSDGADDRRGICVNLVAS